MNKLLIGLMLVAFTFPAATLAVPNASACTSVANCVATQCAENRGGSVGTLAGASANCSGGAVWICKPTVVMPNPPMPGGVYCNQYIVL